MPESPSKPQLAIYAALAIAVLLIGARFLRENGGGEAGSSGAVDATSFTSTNADAGAAPLADGTSADPAAAGASLVVDVKGAVHSPGVYRLADGSRALDAVHRAGGLTRRADRIHVNLAARIVDGGELVVPERAPAGATTVGAATGDAASDADPPVPLALDLNTATAEELEQLDGVGPATAAKIVAYREQNGAFSSIEQLDEVSGIGEAKLAAIRAQLGQ